jgi:ribonuclease D
VLPDAAIIEAARAIPASGEELTAIPGFTGRGARRHVREWMAAVNRARARPESALPPPSAPPVDGPPPAHRWAERDPAAARRLTAVRAAVTALSEARSLPTENLLHPDAVRRLAWKPPEPPDAEAVAEQLAGYGARPWQVDLTAAPIAAALRAAEQDEAEA